MKTRPFLRLEGWAAVFLDELAFLEVLEGLES